MVNRLLGRTSRQGNILVLNDEAHHAYRIRRPEKDEPDLFDDEEEADEFIPSDGLW